MFPWFFLIFEVFHDSKKFGLFYWGVFSAAVNQHIFLQPQLISGHGFSAAM
jgi:hypothetical protein